MSIKIKSMKSFYNLSTAHRQHFDTNPDGTPGHCSGLHGYDRSIHFTFAGEVDEYGWIYPFGDLKKVRAFLEYYFDHTSIIGADDPALDGISDEQLQPGGLLSSLRALPYGVSMEMSSLFIWEQVNPFIYHQTGGRVWVEKIESREHEKNAAFLEVDEETAKKQAESFRSDGEFLDMQFIHEFQKPREVLSKYQE